MTDQLATQLATQADAALTASRALLGVVARSMAEVLDEVTLPQFRVLVVLSTEGTLRVGTLAERMGAVPSTFSRSVDRMVAAGWLVRSGNPENRREVLVDLTPAGHRLVSSVTQRRRDEIRTLLGRLTPQQRDQVSEALELFNQAAGEPAVEELLLLGI